MKRTWWALLLVMSWSAAPAPALAAPDGWQLVLEWSPQYCSRNLRSEEPQCVDEHYFVLQTLKPVFVTQSAPACDDSRLDKEELDRWLPVTLNRSNAQTSWRKHGACSGVGMEEYRVQLDRANRLIGIPEPFQQVHEKRDITAAAIRDAFRTSNPKLLDEQIALRCNGSWLNEVTICVDAGFGFQKCEVQDRCPATLRLRPARPFLIDRQARQTP